MIKIQYIKRTEKNYELKFCISTDPINNHKNKQRRTCLNRYKATNIINYSTHNIVGKNLTLPTSFRGNVEMRSFRRQLVDNKRTAIRQASFYDSIEGGTTIVINFMKWNCCKKQCCQQPHAVFVWGKAFEIALAKSISA